MLAVARTNYRGRGFWANDTTIELWLHLLAHTTPTSLVPQWITRARDDWAIQASVGFQGCVNVGLDAHLAGDPTRETQFLTLVHALDEHLIALGPTIPTATGYHIGGGTEFGIDVDIRILHRFSTALIELITTPPTEPVSDVF